jgi:hypothetical protein
MIMMGVPGAVRELVVVVHVSSSSIRDLKSIEWKTGPENPAALAVTGVNDSGNRGLLQP